MQVASSSLPAAERRMTGVSPAEGCFAYGAEQSSFRADPALDGTVVPTATPGDPLPTCTPVVWPTSAAAPVATSIPATALSTDKGASAPQNLTLSPGSESVDRVVAVPGLQALVWHKNAEYHLVVQSSFGMHLFDVAEVLSADGPAAVALSKNGRIHLYAAGRYAYLEHLGSKWSAPVDAPVLTRPHLVVDPLGYVYLLGDEGGVVAAYHQAPDGTWTERLALSGGASDYDAVLAGDSVVVVTASPAGSQIRLLNDGPVTSLVGADHVNLTYHRDELLVGFGQSSAAYVGRSFDGGVTWSTCFVQGSRYRIESVAAIPTAQGPYAVFWTWHQPDGPMGSHRYIVLSTVQWPTGAGCSVWPEHGQADGLAGDQLHRLSAPGLVSSITQQGRFRIADDGSLLVYDGFSLNARETDVFLVSVHRDDIFSGISHGFSLPDESGARGH